MQPALLAFATATIPRTARVLAPSENVAADLDASGCDVVSRPLHGAGPGRWDAVALLDEELSAAGDAGEALIAEAAEALRPGGLLVASAVGAVGRAADGAVAYTAEALARALGHRGFAVDVQAAPGAAASLRGDPDPTYDPEHDRLPGLLDAAPTIVAAGRLGRGQADRSATFFATLPRKVVASAVLCRDDRGRLLCVHDTFKAAWTIPGGVVDADEDPRSGAAREAWEEAGTRVEVGALLGLFAGRWPDRLVLVYSARSTGPAHGPLHAHEIDDVAWLPLDVALERFVPHVAWQVRRCLEAPGGTWTQPGS